MSDTISFARLEREAVKPSTPQRSKNEENWWVLGKRLGRNWTAAFVFKERSGLMLLSRNTDTREKRGIFISQSCRTVEVFLVALISSGSNNLRSQSYCTGRSWISDRGRGKPCSISFWSLIVPAGWGKDEHKAVRFLTNLNSLLPRDRWEKDKQRDKMRFAVWLCVRTHSHMFWFEVMKSNTSIPIEHLPLKSSKSCEYKPSRLVSLTIQIYIARAFFILILKK